ncbi:MAG TPA: FGGY-family carbohydrate kinase [Acidimicrobiales bacterium]|nr:FGGY-family carbohydrate kinase [Acidimicrobiales bacterium]
MTDASQSARTSELAAGLDIGTTSVKAVVADAAGNIVVRRRLPSKLTVGPAGRFEHDAVATWWESPRALLRETLDQLRASDHNEPQAVAVSAMMPSVAAVDASGRPIGAGLLYGDSRGRGSFSGPDGHAADVGAPRGADPTASDEMAYLAGWAAADVPGAAGYWPAQAVANASLGGEGVTDLASAFAAGTLFGGGGWDAAVCEAGGFSPAQLPRVAVFGERIGELDPAVLGAAGASGSGIALGAGSVDGLCEQLVSGAVQDGDVFVGLGGTLVVWLTVPGWPEEVPGLWRVPHFVAGKALVGGASTAGGMWVDWVDRALRPDDETNIEPWDVPVWWPWAKGERVPLHDRSLRVALAGADISHGPRALRRAACEATGFVVRHIVELAAGTGTSPQRFVLSGGGVRNRDWLQAIADVLGLPVVPVAFPDGAALGSAFLARMALGAESSLDDACRWARWSAPVGPRPAWAAAAEERYSRWKGGLPEASAGGPA